MGNVTIIPKHVDFSQKMKELHLAMCKEIAFVMAATETKELDLLGTDTGHVTIKMEHKFTGETVDIEVKKVILKNDNFSEVNYGEVYITSPDWNFCEDEICISKNQYVIPCSIEELYEAVFEECVTNREKK